MSTANVNVETLTAALLAARAAIDSALTQLAQQRDTKQYATGKRWMSLGEAAKYTGKTRRMLTTMVKNGQIESKMTEGGGKMFVLV